MDLNDDLGALILGDIDVEGEQSRFGLFHQLAELRDHWSILISLAGMDPRHRLYDERSRHGSASFRLDMGDAKAQPQLEAEGLQRGERRGARVFGNVA
jgi:hypothetical protein